MPDYGWNGSKYFSLDTGRFVSPSAVRDALESAIDQSALNMNAISQQLLSSEISLAQWQTGMMKNIKLAHTAAAASANGGWAQMTQSDWGFAGSLIKKQYENLERFAGQIESGKQALNGQILSRADLYGQAPIGTYEAQRQRFEILVNGVEEERRILEATDGANCAGCLEQADLGWQPVGTLKNIGSQECLTNCRCTVEFRKSDGETITSDE